MDLDSLRRLLRWTWLAVGVVVLYVGFVFFQRWQSNRSLEEASRARQDEQARKVVDELGGGELKVLMFYAVPPAIEAGAATRLCYGVAFAKTVRMDPPVAGVRPALNHCVEAKPERTTTYTLTASDETGQVRVSKVEVVVR